MFLSPVLKRYALKGVARAVKADASKAVGRGQFGSVSRGGPRLPSSVSAWPLPARPMPASLLSTPGRPFSTPFAKLPLRKPAYTFPALFRTSTL
eukprot:15457257-Alexandrium_andersonii.AAC.1